MSFRTLTWLILGVGLGLVAAGCKPKEPDRWAQAQRDSSQRAEAVSAESAAGSSFNRFFPQVEKPYDIVFKQEKTGFAQASLQRDGIEVAVLSVSDTRNNPEAADKYRGVAETLGGYPRASIGETATGVLVGDRFQVQIRSADPTFGPQDREQWLTRFDLESISRIK